MIVETVVVGTFVVGAVVVGLAKVEIAFSSKMSLRKALADSSSFLSAIEVARSISAVS